MIKASGAILTVLFIGPIAGGLMIITSPQTR